MAKVVLRGKYKRAVENWKDTEGFPTISKTVQAIIKGYFHTIDRVHFLEERVKVLELQIKMGPKNQKGN